MVRKLARFAATLLFTTVEVLALDPNRAVSQDHKTTWQVEDGLPQNAVRALAQDSDGALLVGTVGGLVRFDGRRFQAMPAGSALDSLDAADALLRTPDGTLWVGFESGNVSWRRGEITTVLRQSDGLAGGAIRSIYRDHTGAIWIASHFGITRIHDGRTEKIAGVSGVFAPRTAVFTDTADSGVVIATSQGLWLYESGRLRSLRYEASRFGNPMSVYFDRSGRLWMGTSEFLLDYDLQQEKAQIQPAIRGPIIAILEDHQGNLWIGNFDNGLTRKYGSRIDRLSTLQGLPDGHVRSLFEDTEGNLWIGTRGTGLIRLTDSVMTPYSIGGEPEIFASTILEDRQDRLWLGTWGGGLFQLKDGQLVSMHLPTPSVNSLAEDPSGQLWIGIFSGGILRYDGRHFERFAPAKTGVPENNVNALLVDRAGALWVGTNGGGIVRFACGRPERNCAQFHLPHARVNALCEDTGGIIWAGTTDGLFAFQGDKATRYGREQGLANDSIISLSLDSAGSVWVGTKTVGLDRVSGDRIVHLRGGDGLPNSPITSVLDDRLGFLWLASAHGVVRVRRSALEERINGRGGIVQSETYGRMDGMPSSECRGISQPPSGRQRNGLLWFATAKGFASADPGRVRRAWLPPRASVDRILVDQATVDGKNGITLQPGTRQLEIRFAAARLAAPEHVQFRYRLVGYDPDWVLTDSDQAAHYGRLPSGTYRLQFSARDGIGDWNTATNELNIRQIPVFYRTLWFNVVIAAVILAMAWSFTRWRVLRLRGRLAAVADERNRIAREWHDTLMAGFAAISWQLEATQTQLKTSSAEQADSALDIARSMVRHCQAEARRIIWDLRSKAEEDEALVDILSKAAQNLTSGTEIAAEVISEGTRRQLPGLVAHNLLRIGQEAMANAVRHASPSRITLRLRYQSAGVQLSVKDDGCGFDSTRRAQDGHFGILGMDERARKLRGTVTIVSAPGRGTEVVATLPVNRARKDIP